MTKDEMMPKYEAGERKCPICGEPLPAHQTWRGARYRFCGKPQCAKKVKAKRKSRYVGANEYRCDGEGCENFVPEGRYGTQPAYLSCSAECWYRRSLKGNMHLTCGCGCGQEFLRASQPETVCGLVFISKEHHGDYLREKHLTEHCGVFYGIATEFLEGYASLRYRNPYTVRTDLRTFLLFLCEKHIDSLEEVTPKVITQYLVWGKESGHRNAAHGIWCVSAFFKWMIAEGRRKAGNPVVSLIHNTPRSHRMARPLGTDDLVFAWKLLHERGNSRLRLALAIGEEAGLRISEMCRLRIADVNAIEQTLFVGLPNKANRERSAFFGEKTKRYFIEWMAVRNPTCGHDYLFHNTQGNPLLADTLRDEFNRTLCKTYNGKRVHETGFDTWSTHRLRHTMATRLLRGGADTYTLMGAGGWNSAQAMAGYALVEADVAQRRYNEAMRRANEQKQSAPSRKAITPAELLQRRQPQPVKSQFLQESERCV
jgi:site-specific recombinase XerD